MRFCCSWADQPARWTNDGALWASDDRSLRVAPSTRWKLNADSLRYVVCNRCRCLPNSRVGRVDAKTRSVLLDDVVYMVNDYTVTQSQDWRRDKRMCDWGFTHSFISSSILTLRHCVVEPIRSVRTVSNEAVYCAARYLVEPSFADQENVNIVKHCNAGELRKFVREWRGVRVHSNSSVRKRVAVVVSVLGGARVAVVLAGALGGEDVDVAVLAETRVDVVVDEVVLAVVVAVVVVVVVLVGAQVAVLNVLPVTWQLLQLVKMLMLLPSLYM